jgi:pyrroline-5-carboxylate reductase
LIVAVIGAGKIGEAVARGIAQSDFASQVIVTKRNLSTLKHLRSEKIRVTTDNRSAARSADVIILSVKAGDAKGVLSQISDQTEGKVVISLMAAVSLRMLEGSMPKAKLVRSMPNIAASIGEAITAYTPGKGITKKDLGLVRNVLSTFGDHIEVPESMMNAVTALSGSGPAYIALLIEAMVSAGLKVGIPRDIALKLATKTLTGTADLLSKNGIHPAELRDLVTTPAGTTIAGIYELEKGAIRTSMMNAVDAATQAAERVAKKFQENE